MSRTVLASTFKKTLGVPPISYLTSWRMQIAAGLLADTETPVYNISEAVGYESEASFVGPSAAQPVFRLVSGGRIASRIYHI